MCKVCLAILGLATLAAAAPIHVAESAELSADAFEAHPGAGVRSGRLYVRGDSRRFDYQAGGLPVIEIDLPASGVRRVLFPLTRTYIEQPYTPEPAAAPCAPAPGRSCAKTGAGELGGTPTEIWTMRPLPAGRETRVWWDATRRLALRAEYADGTVMEARRAADEIYEDRKVERWQISYKLPGGRLMPAEALFDGALGMAIAERRGDGARRHLVNIESGPVDPARFEVPSGWRRLPADPRSAAEVAGATAAAGAGRRDVPVAGPRALPPLTADAAERPATPSAATATTPAVGPSAVAPVPAQPAAPAAAPPARPAPSPEPARRVEVPRPAPAPAAASASPAATPATIAPAVATVGEPIIAREAPPPLPGQKPAATAPQPAAKAATANAGAVSKPEPARPAAARSKPTRNDKAAAGKGKTQSGPVPNPSSIPTLGALPAAGASAAARTAAGAKKTGKPKSSGSTRSTKGRRKAR